MLDTETTNDYAPLALGAPAVPGAVARERAARAQKKQNDATMASGKNVMMLPGGAVVDVSAYLDFRYDFKQNWWIAEPQKLMKDPKPPESGYVYAWPRLVDAKGKDWPETAARLRSGKYRAITPDEIQDHTDGAIMTHKGVNGDQVLWGDLVLVEVDPKFRREQYDVPVMTALTRLSSYEESLADDVETISQGTAVLNEFQPEGEAVIDGQSISRRKR